MLAQPRGAGSAYSLQNFVAYETKFCLVPLVEPGHFSHTKPKTEELLYLLLWACDIAARPTFRNLTDSFESWAYRTGFHRQLATLERQHLLETSLKSGGGRLHRLTEAGRLMALGARDPIARWKRRWD